MRPLKDLTNSKFGKLLVVGLAKERTSSGQLKWECVCDCGNHTAVYTGDLNAGRSTSCGCNRNARSSIVNAIHGLRKSVEYTAWANIKARCSNTQNPGFVYYGGRDIVICERWKDSFENFYADMGPCPGPEYSIDRFPNNDGNYEPGNCRWATATQQLSNRRNTVIHNYNGVDYMESELCRIHGIIQTTFRARIARGLSVELALGKK